MQIKLLNVTIIMNVSLLWDAFIVIIRLERRKNEWESMAECIPSGIVTVSFLHSILLLLNLVLYGICTLHILIPNLSHQKSNLCNQRVPPLKLAKKQKQQVSNVG